jgi:hypothetical protein
VVAFMRPCRKVPSPLGDCVIIRFFVAADFSLRKPFVEFQQLTSIWTATKSKHDYDTSSGGEGQGEGDQVSGLSLAVFIRHSKTKNRNNIWICESSVRKSVLRTEVKYDQEIS